MSLANNARYVQFNIYLEKGKGEKEKLRAAAAISGKSMNEIARAGMLKEVARILEDEKDTA